MKNDWMFWLMEVSLLFPPLIPKQTLSLYLKIGNQTGIRNKKASMMQLKKYKNSQMIYVNASTTFIQARNSCFIKIAIEHSKLRNKFWSVKKRWWERGTKHDSKWSIQIFEAMFVLNRETSTEPQRNHLVLLAIIICNDGFSFLFQNYRLENGTKSRGNDFLVSFFCFLSNTKKKDRPGITILYYTESIGSGLNNDSLIKAICILTLSLFKSR